MSGSTAEGRGFDAQREHFYKNEQICMKLLRIGGGDLQFGKFFHQSIAHM